MALLPVLPSEVFTAIPSGQSYVDGLVNKYVLRTKNSQGIGGFVFDYLGDVNVSLQADITDHFIEDNTAIQDHVAIRPIKVTMRGFVAELTLPKPQGVVGALASAQSALTQVQAYLGKYTPGVTQTLAKAVTQVQNTVQTIDNTLAKAQNIISLFPGAPPNATKQAKAYSQLFTAMQQKLPMQIDTPYRVLKDMIIEQIVFVQPEETKYWSDITVTLKQIQFVEVTEVADDGTFAGRLAQQAQTPTNKGVVPGASVAKVRRGPCGTSRLDLLERTVMSLVFRSPPADEDDLLDMLRDRECDYGELMGEKLGEASCW